VSDNLEQVLGTGGVIGKTALPREPRTVEQFVKEAQERGLNKHQILAVAYGSRWKKQLEDVKRLLENQNVQNPQALQT
jgi:hypothetical protein